MKIILTRLRHYIFILISRVLKLPEPELIIGPGSICKIPQVLKKNKVKKAFIVTDKDLVRIGLVNRLIKILDEDSTGYFIYDNVPANPSIASVEEGLILFRENNCDGIIAFGGGSPIDCAKIIGARSISNKPVKKMKGLFKVRKKLPFLLAVPTTAGTGSEATIVAVISDPQNKEKFAINSIPLTPLITVLDPQLTVGLPPGLTASTGMDALTHAIEAYLNLISTAYTRKLSLEAISLIFDHLGKAYGEGDNLESREAMLLASHYGGKAFTRAYVGYAHAVAHNLGGFYGIPHGLANAVVLPYILELSRSDYGEKKMAEIARYVGIGKPDEINSVLAGKLIDKIRDLSSTMNIPAGFKEITEDDIPELAKRISKEGNPTYPVPKLLWQNDFENLLKQLRSN